MRRLSTTYLTCLVALAAFEAGISIVLGEDQPAADRQPPAYETAIQPLFRAKCLQCHGGDARKADLDLSTLAGIRKGGESGVVIVAGEPDASALYEKVRSGEMPPDGKDPLSEEQVETIARWIAAGAKSTGGNGSTTSESAAVASTAALSQHDVIPIMLRRCSACHGLHRQEGGLDLRTKAAMLRGGKSGPAIVPGKPEQSRAWQRIRAGEMPPPERLVEASVKPVEPSEADKLARWIAAGAPEVAIEPDVATTSPDPLVSDRDRDFWAFRPPAPVTVPRPRDSGRVGNPIDAFILDKLEQKGLTLAPEADRETLLRRVCFDVTGLPPEPAELAAYLADRDPNAYRKLVDRLLASPRYGERWARYWLDLAGYADSEGKREQDLPRPHAWRYRDYVIQSLNADKPYNRFLLEQLAGDELEDYEHAPEITETIYDNLVATGFLRMVPDPTWANITGYAPDRIDVIADEIDVLGSGVMGLTLKCARCHSHKFDPIPQRDYYRLLAVFKGAFDEYDWLKPDVRPGLGPVSQDFLGGRHLPYVTTTERTAWEAREAKLSEEIKTLTSAAEGNQDRARALEAQRSPEPRIQALWDRGQPTPTYLYRRGDPLSPGPLVGPGVPSVLTDGKSPFEAQPPWPGARQTGRRLAFARWLTRPDHPLTARVAVNRLWKQHFGAGIVKTLGNFGRAGSPPTHVELLDWLAREFVRRGWSFKEMHRLMLTSATYRQSSAVTAEAQRIDPHDSLYSRMPLRRLDAEDLYDSLLLVAGRLDETRFGPADRVEAREDGLVTPTASARGWRRLIYVRQSRKQLATHLETFDFPQMNPNCLERRDSIVASQALHLMNNRMVYELAEQFAARVTREAGTDPAQQVERAYLIALSRTPSEEERALGVEALNRLVAEASPQSATAGNPDPESARVKALMAYCHAIMNSAEFLYVD